VLDERQQRVLDALGERSEKLAQLAQLMFPRFEHNAIRELLAKGVNASPGAAIGKVVFDSDTAVAWARSGEKVILVRRETTPDDLNGMIAAEGILTSRGGKTSHAAVVARGMGKTAVCGADALSVDTKGRHFTTTDGQVFEEGTVISIDGTSGEVFLGEVPVVVTGRRRRAIPKASRALSWADTRPVRKHERCCGNSSGHRRSTASATSRSPWNPSV
jgi:pyruvate,orthophosphate dikinase